MTLKGGTSQACAACKYQRRRCTSECPLAPYFPPDQPKLFQNAHRLFGVSNILKILKKLDPNQKATAMWSIMYQANERDRDPVHGCLGKICHLRYQIWHAEQELLSLLAHLDFYRQQQHHANANPNPNPNPAQGLELVMAPPAAPPDPSCYVSADANNPMWAPLAQAEAAAAALFDQPQQQQQPLEVVPEYDEMPFFDTMDDRQSYIDTKDAYDTSSEESVLKEGNDQRIEHIVDNELKNAAACLTLTSVN